MSCANYIRRLLKLHGWDKDSSKPLPSEMVSVPALNSTSNMMDASDGIATESLFDNNDAVNVQDECTVRSNNVQNKCTVQSAIQKCSMQFPGSEKFLDKNNFDPKCSSKLRENNFDPRGSRLESSIESQNISNPELNPVNLNSSKSRENNFDPRKSSKSLENNFNSREYSELKITLNDHKPEQQASMKSNRPIAPLPHDCIEQMYKGTGPPEGSVEHRVLEKSIGYSYRTLLGECMYAYITCRPDIGYAVTTLSKFSCVPSAFHYRLRRGVAKYLRSTINWGVRFR